MHTNGLIKLALLGLAGCAISPSAPRTDGLASVSSPITLSSDGQTVWVVNPGGGSITPLNAITLEAGKPIAVGQEPWGVALTPSGTVIVLNRESGSLSFLEQGTRADLYIGPEPGGLALSSDGHTAYVTVSGSDEVAVVDVRSRQVMRRVPVGRMPWAISVSVDEHVIVTHRLPRLKAGQQEARDHGKEGWISVLRGSSLSEITISPYDFGYPNALEGLAVQGDRVWVSHLLDAPEYPTTFDTSVSAGLSTLSLSRDQELTEARIHLNESDFSTPVNFPRAVALSRDGLRAYVVLAGTDAVMGIDLSNPSKARLIGFWPTGKNPRGIVLNPAGTRAFVMNFLSRDVSVLDLSDPSARREIARVQVAGETLEPQIIRGEVLFNNANDPRLSRLGWLSCASCHLDGGADGTTWLTPDGPRQTQPLWKLEETAPFHASATRDEVQDFELDIRELMGGSGLAAGVPDRSLAQPNGGRSSDLDALAAFVLRGLRVPRAPQADPGALERGRAVFERVGCPQCHGGPHWTLSQLPGPVGSLAPGGELEVRPALREVGTLGPQDLLGSRGFDIPTLLGLHTTAPYLHDGSAQTLERVLDNPKHLSMPLSPQEQTDLMAFLDSLDATTLPGR